MIPPAHCKQSSLDLSYARQRTPGDQGVVMSRILPPHPNLEHLKKQAKELLHDLKQQNPASKLADAQYALAREYGFASWPKLKTYVEALSGSIPHSVQSETEEGTDVLESASTQNPFAGKWKADLTRSQRHPIRQFQSAMIEFTVEGNNLTLADTVVEEFGQKNTSISTILVDGNEHLLENGNGSIFMAKWRDSHTFEVVTKKDGEVVGWGVYEVSEDGHILTITGDEQMIVLDRL